MTLSEIRKNNNKNNGFTLSQLREAVNSGNYLAPYSESQIKEINAMRERQYQTMLSAEKGKLNFELDKVAVAAQTEYDREIGATTIADLKAQLEKLVTEKSNYDSTYKENGGWTPSGSNYDRPSQSQIAPYQEWRTKSSEYNRQIDKLKREIFEKEEFHQTAVDHQDFVSFEGLKENTDFAEKSEKGKARENPTPNRTETIKQVDGKWYIQAGIVGKKKEIKNILTFVRENQYDAEDPWGSTKNVYADETFQTLLKASDDEVDLYSYLLEIDEKKAQRYLELLMPQLLDERSNNLKETLDTPVIKHFASVAQGMANYFDSVGIKDFSNDPSMIALEKLYAEAEGLDKYLMGAGVNIGNVLPSILLSYFTSGLASGFGAAPKLVSAIGTSTNALSVGVSAKGSAYKQKIAEGWYPEDAETYATLIGISEASLESILSGIIGTTGFGVDDLLKKADMIDNTLIKLSTKSGIRLVSEEVEEFAQLYLEPAFEMIFTGGEYDQPTVDEIIETAIVTALSTGTLNAPSSIAEVLNASLYRTKTYGEKYSGLDNESIQALVNEGLESPKGSKAQLLAEKLQQKINNGQKITGQEIAALVSKNESQITIEDTAKINNAVKNRLTELGETTDIDTVSKAITKQLSGEQLTKAEQKVITESRFGQRVLNEATVDNIESGEYSSAWAESIGTDRINSEAYNLGVEDIDAAGNNGYNNTVKNANVGGNINGGQNTELLAGGQVSAVGGGRDSLREQSPNTAKLNGYLGNVGTQQRLDSVNNRAGESGWLVQEGNSESQVSGFKEGVLRAVSRIAPSGRDTVGRIIDSKVLEEFKNTVFKDENGNLLSLYHWTTAVFDKFAKGEFGFHLGILEAAHDRYLEKAKEEPNTPIGNYKEVYVNITNPIELKDNSETWDAAWVILQLKEKGLITQQQEKEFSTMEGFYEATYDNPAAQAVREFLFKKGYDGIIYKNDSEGSGSYSVIALRPDQILTVAENGVLKENIGVTEADLNESASLMPENSDLQSTAEGKISTLSAASPEYNPIEDLHYKSVGVERLTADQKKLRKVGQQFGAKVLFKDLDEIRIDPKTGKEFLFSPEGQFDPETNTITLNTNVKDYHRPVEYILKHELTHSFEIDKENYALFATQVLRSEAFSEYVHSKGFESADAWATDIIKQYSGKGVKGYQGPKAQLLANQEMVANFVGDMLFGGRTDITEKLLNSMTPTQRKGFIAKIKEFFAKLKQFFKGTAELTEIERLENLFLETANKVAAKNKTAIEGSGDIVYSFKNGNNSESKAIIDIIKRNISKISSELRFSVKGSTIDQATRKSDYVLNIFKQQGGEAYNSEIGIVELTRSGAKSTVFHGFGSQKLAATEAIKSVIEKGNIISFIKNYDNTGVDRYVIAAKGEINGELSYVGVVVKSYPNNKSNSKFYLHEVLIIEEDSPIMTAPQLSVDAVSESSNYSISENGDTVNNNYAQIDKQYSFAVEKNMSLVDKAEQLERELKAENKTEDEIREAVWKEYQIIRDPEGVWKYEIDDSDMEVYPNGDLFIKDDPDYKEYMALKHMTEWTEEQADRFAELDDMFLLEYGFGEPLLKNYVKHDKLFAKYPQLKEAKIDFDELGPGERGYYDPINNKIVLDERFKMLDRIGMNIDAIHEIQHVMQKIDDTEPGASEKYWNARLLRGDRLPINPATGKQYTPYEAYMRTRGEIEARESASRVDMTEEQRRETVPNLGWENSLSAREPVLMGEYDAEYSSAIENGNTAKAQQMVDAEIANISKGKEDLINGKKGLILPEPDISKDMRSEAERISEIVGGKANAKYVARQEVRELGKELGWKVLYGDVYAKDENGNLIYIKDQDGNLVPKRAEAKVDKTNKIITIDYQNKYPIKTIVKHELTHFLEINSKTYSTFAKKVFSSEVFEQWLSQEGVSDIDEYRDSIISQYIGTKGFDSIEAAEISADFEIVARFVADNLFNNDGQMMQRIAEMMNPTQRSKFYEFICSIFEKLKVFFKGKDGYSEVVALEREWVKAYRAANSVWESQFGDKISRSTYSALETHFMNKLISKLNEMKADSGESAFSMPLDEYFIGKHTSAKNETNNRGYLENVAKTGKSRYNEYQSNVMQWAYNSSTNTGDVKLFNDRGKEFVLNEATEDGYIEIARGTYEEVRELYEEMQRRADNSSYGYSQKFRYEQRRNMRAEFNGEAFGGNGVRNYKSDGEQKFRTDTTGNFEAFRTGDKGEQLSNKADSGESANFMPSARIRRSAPIDLFENIDYNDDTHYGERLKNTPNFLKPTTEREWQAFCRSFANQTNGMKNNEYRIASVFTADNHYIIEADGYMSGRIVSKSSIIDYREKERFFDDYNSSKVFNVRNDRNGNRQGYYSNDGDPLENGGTDTFYVEMDEFIEQHPKWFTNKGKTYRDFIKELNKNNSSKQADSGESANFMLDAIYGDTLRGVDSHGGNVYNSTVENGNAGGKINGSKDAELLAGGQVSAVSGGTNSLREQSPNTAIIRGELGTLSGNQGIDAGRLAAGTSAWISGTNRQPAQKVGSGLDENFLRGIRGVALQNTDTIGRTLSPELQEELKDSVFRTEDGKIISFFHWTPNSFEVFKYGDGAYHFGTLPASIAIKNKSQKNQQGNIKEVYINSKNPLVVYDNGSFSPSIISQQLVKCGLMSSEMRKELSRKEGFFLDDINSEACQYMLKYIEELGFDSYFYKNKHEDTGAWSVGVFRPEQIITVAENGVLKENIGVTEADSGESAFSMPFDEEYFIAKQKDISVTQKAEVMEKRLANKGLSDFDIAYEVWKKYGVVRDDKGEWVYEINDWDLHMDKHGRVRGNTDKKNLTVPDYIDLPRLYEKYPELNEVRVIFKRGLEKKENKLGYYDPNTNSIVIGKALLDNPNNLQRTFIHEIQHAIQNIDGRDSGLNDDFWELYKVMFLPSDMPTNKEITFENYEEMVKRYELYTKELPRSVVSAVRRFWKAYEANDIEKANSILEKVQLSKFSDEFDEYNFWYYKYHKLLKDGINVLTPFEAYMNSSGEKEARMVEDRYIDVHEKAREFLIESYKSGRKIEDEDFNNFMASYKREMPIYRPDLAIFKDEFMQKVLEELERRNRGIEKAEEEGHELATTANKSNYSGVEKLSETQYNNFGWVRQNDVLTPYEYNTLLSRFADFKHNKDKYPVTRFGEAVIHSTECPNVIMYVKGNIGNPQITKIIEIIADDNEDISVINERIIKDEYKQELLPYEAIASMYGEKCIRLYRKRDYASFRQYRAEQEGRGGAKSDSFGAEQFDRGGSLRESEEAYSGDDGVKQSPEIDREEKFYSELMRGLLSANGTEDAQLPREDENSNVGGNINGGQNTELLAGGQVSAVSGGSNSLREQSPNTAKLNGYLEKSKTVLGLGFTQHKAGESGWLVKSASGLRSNKAGQAGFEEGILRAVSGITPSGRDTIGRIIDSKVLEEFKDTVFKDENGNLLSLYHWTTATFDKFAKGEFGFHLGTLEAAHDRYLQKLRDNPDTPIGNYKEVYVNIKNPIELSDENSVWEPSWVVFQLKNKGLITQEQYDGFSVMEGFFDATYDNPAAQAVREFLFKKGYDGIIYKNDSEGSGNYSVIALKPEQIITVAENGVLKENIGVTEADSGESAFSMPFDEEYFIAKQRDISVTQKAEVMEKRLANKGLSDFDIAYEVWKKYGVVRDDKGEWVYEINDWDLHMDKHGRVRGNTDKKNLTVPDYIDLPRLYEKYPELDDVKVVFKRDLEKKEGVPAYYDHDMNQIVIDKALLDNPNKLERAFIHEIQHAIQKIDGRDSGSSESFWIVYQNIFLPVDMPTNKDTSKETLESTKMMYDMLTESLPAPVTTAVKEFWEAVEEGDDDRQYEIYEVAMQDDEFAEMFEDYSFWYYKYHRLFEDGVNVLSPREAVKYSSGEMEARMVEKRYKEVHETSQTLINALTKIGEKFTLEDIKKFMASYRREMPIYRPDLAIFEDEFRQKALDELERRKRETEEAEREKPKERELAATGSKSNYSGVEKLSETQYNNFGWVRQNDVLTPYEYNTLLSRFADFKHNKDKYPVTRFGEAVIHSTECPNVIMYVKGNIGNPQITKILKINSSIPNTIQSDVQKEIISNERNGLSLPWENVKSIFGEGAIDVYKRRDFRSFQESEGRGKRELGEKDNTYIGNKQDRAGGTGESEEAYSGDDGVKQSPEIDREEKFYSELMRGLLSANGTEDAQLPTREAENADTENESVISETSQKATDEDLIKSLMSGLGVKKIHKEKPIQLHHYATNKNRYFTKLFKKITDRYGLDLDGDWNKDLLQHQGRHPNDYHNFILKELKKINIIANGNKDIFLHLFENRVKKIIRNNQDMLYSKYWKNLKEK